MIFAMIFVSFRSFSYMSHNGTHQRRTPLSSGCRGPDVQFLLSSSVSILFLRSILLLQTAIVAASSPNLLSSLFRITLHQRLARFYLDQPLQDMSLIGSACSECMCGCKLETAGRRPLHEQPPFSLLFTAFRPPLLPVARPLAGTNHDAPFDHWRLAPAHLREKPTKTAFYCFQKRLPCFSSQVPGFKNTTYYSVAYESLLLIRALVCSFPAGDRPAFWAVSRL